MYERRLRQPARVQVALCAVRRGDVLGEFEHQHEPLPPVQQQLRTPERERRDLQRDRMRRLDLQRRLRQLHGWRQWRLDRRLRDRHELERDVLRRLFDVVLRELLVGYLLGRHVHELDVRSGHVSSRRQSGERLRLPRPDPVRSILRDVSELVQRDVQRGRSMLRHRRLLHPQGRPDVSLTTATRSVARSGSRDRRSDRAPEPACEQTCAPSPEP